MGISIKSIFDNKCSKLKIDRKFIKRLHSLRTHFINRNEDHLSFFSSGLLGVNPIRYKPSDRDVWYDEIMEIEPKEIRSGLKDVDYLDPDWVRANDIVNLSSVWLLNAIHNSKTLSNKEKEKGLTDVILLLQYKFISSIMFHYFKYPTNKPTAVAAYEALSMKFEIKQYGTWQALLEHRARTILDKNSIHYNAYTKMNNDGEVVNMISDVQQRIRENVKKYWVIFDKIHNQNLKIGHSTVFVELDGKKELLDRTRDHSDYIRYLKDVVGDKSTFIRTELLDIIVEAVHTMRREHLIQALEYCSKNYGKGGDKKIESLVDESLLHTYQYLSDNIGILSTPSDLPTIMYKLKNLYTASKMSDQTLISMRDMASDIVGKSVRSRNKAALSSVSTGLQLYIVIRAFAKKHYEG